MAVGDNKITQLVTAITSKITTLISNHNTDSNAHNTLFNNKSDSTHSHGSISNSGYLGSTANKPLITTNNGKITTGSFGNSANTFCEGNDSRLSDDRNPKNHNQASSTITDTNNYPNISNTLQTQESINNAINTKLGYLNVNIFEVVDSLGTASEATTNKLYLIKSTSGLDDNYDTYITIKNGSTYNWEKIDTTALSVSIDPNLYVKYADVIDNLNNTSTTCPLSANQGRQLKNSIDNLSTVAKTGSYNDLSNKPTIPNAITVDNTLSSTSTNPLQNKAIYTQLSGKANNGHTHDDRYYTESEVDDLINALKTWTTVYNANGCKLQVNTTTREAQLEVEASVNISSANTDIGIATVTTTYKPPRTMRVVAHNGIANIAILIFSSDGKLYSRCTATGSKTLNGIFRYVY